MTQAVFQDYPNSNLQLFQLLQSQSVKDYSTEGEKKTQVAKEKAEAAVEVKGQGTAVTKGESRFSHAS